MAKAQMKDTDMKRLWANSGNICAFPGCDVKLSHEGSVCSSIVIGEMAHIKGEKPDAPRYDQSQSDEERNGYNNRIVLCPTHHTEIDKDEKKYTVEKLLEWKRNQEKLVDYNLSKAELNITFAELEVITKYLVSIKTEEIIDLTTVPYRDKIIKNKLSNVVVNRITIGMLKSRLVAQYIDSQLDGTFGERLKTGFVNKYLELKKSGLNGDDIFYELFDFATNSSEDIDIQAAGLAVLTYFFETCEVFEK